MLALIAVALFATALSLRARLRAQRERRPGAKGVDPLAAARAVVFGQASALVAALVVGMYGGTGLYLVMYDLDMDPRRREQAIYAGAAVWRASRWSPRRSSWSGSASSPRTRTVPAARRGPAHSATDTLTARSRPAARSGGLRFGPPASARTGARG